MCIRLRILWSAVLTLTAPCSSDGLGNTVQSYCRNKKDKKKNQHSASFKLGTDKQNTICFLRNSMLVPSISDTGSTCCLLPLPGMTQCLPESRVHILLFLAPFHTSDPFEKKIKKKITSYIYMAASEELYRIQYSLLL